MLIYGIYEYRLEHLRQVFVHNVSQICLIQPVLVTRVFVIRYERVVSILFLT